MRLPRRKRACLFVTSCRAQMGIDRRRICTETWLSRIDERYFDWHFVVADPDLPAECVFDDRTMICRTFDDWLNLVYKTQIFCRWAFNAGYEYVVKADDDTYCNTDLLKGRIEGTMRPARFDVMAYMLPLEGPQPGPNNWYPAGPLYVLSRKTAGILAETPLWAENEDVVLGKALCRREDVVALHDRWFSNLIPPQASSACWERKRVGGHFKNMSLMYEVHRQLYG